MKPFVKKYFQNIFLIILERHILKIFYFSFHISFTLKRYFSYNKLIADFIEIFRFSYLHHHLSVALQATPECFKGICLDCRLRSYLSKHSQTVLSDDEISVIWHSLSHRKRKFPEACWRQKGFNFSLHCFIWITINQSKCCEKNNTRTRCQEW